jgi:hypothetical protein
MESNGDGQDWLSFAWWNGVSVNKEGGYYCCGRQYGVEKKLAVGDCYKNKKKLCGGRPNLMEIAREHKVLKKFVRKIEGKSISMMAVLSIRRRLRGRWSLGGPSDQDPLLWMRGIVSS